MSDQKQKKLIKGDEFDFRTTLKPDSSQLDLEILQPINLELKVTRNLAASWYLQIPGVKVQGGLYSLNVG